MQMPDKQDMTQFYFKFSSWVNRIGLILSDLIAFSVAFIFSQTSLQLLGEKNPDFLEWMNSPPGQARVWIFGLLVALHRLDLKN